MKTINLRDYYPFYHNDLFIEVSDEVASALQEAERQERNYLRRVVYNKAFYSLDAGDGIEQTALFQAMSPCEIYKRKMTMEQLYAALDALPDKQGRRALCPLHFRGAADGDRPGRGRRAHRRQQLHRARIEEHGKNAEKHSLTPWRFALSIVQVNERSYSST